MEPGRRADLHQRLVRRTGGSRAAGRTRC